MQQSVLLSPYLGALLLVLLMNFRLLKYIKICWMCCLNFFHEICFYLWSLPINVDLVNIWLDLSSYTGFCFRCESSNKVSVISLCTYPASKSLNSCNSIVVIWLFKFVNSAICVNKGTAQYRIHCLCFQTECSLCKNL